MFLPHRRREWIKQAKRTPDATKCRRVQAAWLQFEEVQAAFATAVESSSAVRQFQLSVHAVYAKFLIDGLTFLGQHTSLQKCSRTHHHHLVLLESVYARRCMVGHHNGYVEGRTDALQFRDSPKVVSTRESKWQKSHAVPHEPARSEQQRRGVNAPRLMHRQ